ncbi:MAG: UTP--glucose-1-phosphate uridylyltransferase GalU [Pseudomonadota bacterium]
MRPVRSVVVPVAGLGTRVLPATKTIPKELLTVVDRPLIDYVYEEAREAGCEHFIFVTGRGKSAIEDYFDHAFELEATLEAKNKTAVLDDLVYRKPPAGAVSYTRQQAPLGLGHAVLCARRLVGDEPFAVILPDDVVQNERGCLAQMIDAYNEVGGNLVAIEEVPQDRTNKYGVVAPEGPADGRLVKMSGMVEKPDPADAPSNLAIIGRYILQSEIFPLLADQGAGAGGEIQLTDSMATLMKAQTFHGFRFEGARHDCGDKLGWLKANVAMGLAREEFAADFRAYLKDAIG